MTRPTEATPGDVAPSGRRDQARLPGARRGVLSGALGGFCCFAGAIATGLGMGGAGFFGTLMGRYQPLFLAASVLAMCLWVSRAITRARREGRGLRAAALTIARPAAVMVVVWGVTLMVAMTMARIAGLS